MTRLRSLVALLLLATTALADFDIVVEPTHPITKNIRFVVDVSGSMSDKRLTAAISTVLSLAEQPIDELQIALITFDTDHQTWIGKPDPDAYRPVPPGWAQLPDPELVGDNGALAVFIRGNLKTGGTNPQSAIREAIDDRKDLTVVVITDGEFPPASLVGIPAYQAARIAKNLDPAELVFYGVVEEFEQDVSINDRFKEFAKEFGGSYLRHREPPIELPEPVPFDVPGLSPY